MVNQVKNGKLIFILNRISPKRHNGLCKQRSRNEKVDKDGKCNAFYLHAGVSDNGNAPPRFRETSRSTRSFIHGLNSNSHQTALGLGEM
jgi:hypothetical protein